MTDKDPSLAGPHLLGSLPPIETLPEYKLLIGEDVVATPGASTEGDPAVEAKRTRMSIDCFVEAHRGDMRKFALLDTAQRQDLHQETRNIVSDNETFDATYFLTLTHDIFKSGAARKLMGIGPEVDHDEAYSILLTNPAYCRTQTYCAKL